MPWKSRVMAKTRFRKYAWVGNKIAEEDMAKMYAIKSKKKIPITKQVSDAVKKYLANIAP